MLRTMNASAVSVSVILFYVSWIGFLVPELKTASASFIERTDGPRKNLRHGAHRDEHTTGITDGGFENVETTRSLIIGGRDAEDYPRSIVFLSDRIDDLQCGGSLISPTIVLTAGHCEISLLHEAVFFRYEFDNPSQSSEDIDPSSHSENEIRIKIKEEILHPEYERRTLQHDVMLVVLERSPNDVVGNETETNLVTIEGDDFPISRIENSPIVPYMQLHKPDNPSLQDLLDRIEERKAQNGEGGNSRSNNGKSPKTTDLELKALGWGHTVDGLNGNPSDVLQEVTLNYVPNEECEKAAENEQISYGDRITDDMMCTWESSRDTCHGDSGGPVVIANPNKESEIPFLQVGIISWGEDCADHVFPGVASRVSEAYDWIRDRVCSIDGSGAPAYFGCLDEHTYSPAPSMSPTTVEDGLEAEVRKQVLEMIDDGSGSSVFATMMEDQTVQVAIEIFLDIYSSETSWKLVETDTGITVHYVGYKEYKYENKVKEVLDLKQGVKYTFTIFDLYGDGITNKGSYRIYLVDDSMPDSVGTILVEDDGDFEETRSNKFAVPASQKARTNTAPKKINRIGLIRQELLP